MCCCGEGRSSRCGQRGLSSVHRGGLPGGSSICLLLLSPLLLVSFPHRAPPLGRGTSLWPLGTGSTRRCPWTTARPPRLRLLVSPGQRPEHDTSCVQRAILGTWQHGQSLLVHVASCKGPMPSLRAGQTPDCPSPSSLQIRASPHPILYHTQRGDKLSFSERRSQHTNAGWGAAVS